MAENWTPSYRYAVWGRYHTLTRRTYVYSFGWNQTTGQVEETQMYPFDSTQIGGQLPELCRSLWGHIIDTNVIFVRGSKQDPNFLSVKENIWTPPYTTVISSGEILNSLDKIHNNDSTNLQNTRQHNVQNNMQSNSRNNQNNVQTNIRNVQANIRNNAQNDVDKQLRAMEKIFFGAWTLNETEILRVIQQADPSQASMFARGNYRRYAVRFRSGDDTPVIGEFVRAGTGLHLRVCGPSVVDQDCRENKPVLDRLRHRTPANGIAKWYHIPLATK